MGAADPVRLSDLPARPARSLSLVRMARLLAISRGEHVTAHHMAVAEYPSDKPLQEVLRAAVSAGNISGAWGSQLAHASNLQAEFISALRPTSIVQRLTNVRRVPFNIRVAKVTSSSTAGWVGPGAPKSVGELALDETSLGIAKAAGIIAVSLELARSASPSAEDVIRAEMIASVNSFTDRAFI